MMHGQKNIKFRIFMSTSCCCSCERDTWHTGRPIYNFLLLL